MGGIADEVALGFEEFLLAGSGLVEVQCELSQFGRSGIGGGACGQIAVGDLSSRMFEAVNRSRDQTCQREADEGHDGCDDRGEQAEAQPDGSDSLVECRTRVRDADGAVDDAARCHGHRDIEQICIQRRGVSAALGPPALDRRLISGRLRNSSRAVSRSSESATLWPVLSTTTIRPPGSAS